MTRYAQHVAPKLTPQSEPVDPRQVENNAGGFTFTLDCWKRLDRFLILGAEGGTYYVGERKLTQDNAKVVQECLAADGLRTVARIVEVSVTGKAPKNDPAIFALALAASHPNAQTRARALAALPEVCRIGTHLFQFCESVNALRGWGRGLRRALARWYTEKTADAAAFQAVKYQQRNGWSHKDVLRLCHAEAAGSLGHEALFRWITTRSPVERSVKRRQADKSVTLSSYRNIDPGTVPALLGGYEYLLKAEKVSDVVDLIHTYGLTHEMIPTQHKNSPAVWSELLQEMPLGAMVRNLGKMTSIGVLAQLSEGSAKVQAALSDRDAIRKARLHPIALLSALRVYAQGHGEKGSLKWNPDPRVIDALNEAFYLAFETIVPTNRPTLLALDVSGSMGSGNINGIPGLTPRDVTAAMAMATTRVEPSYAIFGFSNRFMELKISPKQRLDDVVKVIGNLPFEATDCSLPMLYASKQKLGIDAFVVYTDNETWVGPVHPHIALKEYRQKSGRNSKLVVCGTTSTEFTIAEPTDSGMLDVVGFSADCPAVIADFTREGGER